VAQAFPQFGGLETAEEPQRPEVPHYATNGGGNGAAHHEPAMAEPQMQVETVVEEYAEIAARHEQMAPADQPPAEDQVDAEAPKATIAQRFAARRERRRSGRASSGGSLRDRLRGLVAE
jgi:hypothetical protein